jgi:hypothetical protein
MTASALYLGRVTHRRLTPRTHALAYRIFQLYLDLDEAEGLCARSRLFGFNRPGLLSVHEADHGDGTAGPLKAQIERKVAAQGFATGGAVRMLALPRVLGYAFNPITLYFCHAADGRLTAVVHQVNSTFGERCFYVLPAGEGVIRQGADKRMHVSPFMEMDHAYRFRLSQPAERFDLAIEVVRGETVFLTAGFNAERRAFSDAELLKAWLRHPLVTLKVIGGIHWEALKLWLKGVPLRGAPKAAHPEVIRT